MKCGGELETQKMEKKKMKTTKEKKELFKFQDEKKKFNLNSIRVV